MSTLNAYQSCYDEPNKYSFNTESVQQALAKNPNLPESLFDKMSQSKDPDARVIMANRKDLPMDLLKRLCKDPVQKVSHAAIERYAKRVLEDRGLFQLCWKFRRARSNVFTKCCHQFLQ